MCFINEYTLGSEMVSARFDSFVVRYWMKTFKSDNISLLMHMSLETSFQYRSFIGLRSQWQKDKSVR